MSWHSPAKPLSTHGLSICWNKLLSTSSRDFIPKHNQLLLFRLSKLQLTSQLLVIVVI